MFLGQIDGAAAVSSFGFVVVAFQSIVPGFDLDVVLIRQIKEQSLEVVRQLDIDGIAQRRFHGFATYRFLDLAVGEGPVGEIVHVDTRAEIPKWDADLLGHVLVTH